MADCATAGNDAQPAHAVEVHRRYTPLTQPVVIGRGPGRRLICGRTGQALNLLLDCLQVFHDTCDILGLGKTLSALADTEDQRGHGDAALRLARDALRCEYLAADVTGPEMAAPIGRRRG